MSRRREKRLRAVIAGARRIAAAHGLAVRLETQDRGRHPKLVIEGRGRCRVTPVAADPTDTATRLKLCDVKKLCREICA